MNIFSANGTLAAIEKYGLKTAVFLFVLIAGIVIIRLVGMLVQQTLLKSPLDSTLAGFINAAVKALLLILLLCTCVAVLGVPSAPLVAVLGSAGLALSLALKDSLSNLAAGIVMMGTKPFAAGDYVEIDDTAGTVRHIKLFTSELVTPDNKKIIIPNSKVIGARVVNYSARSTRRIEFTVSVAYGTDLEKLRRVVLDVLSSSRYTLSDPAPMCVFTGAGSSSLDFSARMWVLREQYWDAYWEVGELLTSEIMRSGIEIPYNKLNVYLKKEA